MLPAEGALFSPSVGEGEIFRRSCGADAEGEIDPLPKGGGSFALGGREPCKRGYKTPWAGFLYPLLRLPLIFRRPRLPAVARLKSEGEHGFYLCALLFLCAVALRLRGLPRMIVRGRMVQGGKSAAGNVFCVISLLSGFPGVSVGRGAARIDCGCCLTPD